MTAFSGRNPLQNRRYGPYERFVAAAKEQIKVADSTHESGLLRHHHDTNIKNSNKFRFIAR